MNIEICAIPNNIDLSQFSAVLLWLLILKQPLKEFFKLLSFFKWYLVLFVFVCCRILHTTGWWFTFPLRKIAYSRKRKCFPFLHKNLQESQQLCQNLCITFGTKNNMTALNTPFTSSLICIGELSVIGVNPIWSHVIN